MLLDSSDLANHDRLRLLLLKAKFIL